MAYSSTHQVETLKFSITSDNMTVDACYRAGMDPSLSYFAICKVDHLTGRISYISVKRKDFRAFAMYLQRRSDEMGLIAKDFVDEIATGLFLTSTTVTEPNNSRCIYCLRLEMGTWHWADIDLPIEQRRTAVNELDLPIAHARALALHTVKVGQIIDMDFAPPPEQTHLPFYGLRTLGTAHHWTFYLSRESIITNEGDCIQLLPNEPPIVIDHEDDSQEAPEMQGQSGRAASSASEGPAGDQQGRESPVLLDLLGMLQSRSHRAPVPLAPEAVVADRIMRSQENTQLVPLNLTPGNRLNRGPQHVDEFQLQRPSIDRVCRYLICRAYEVKIMAFGVAPYTEDDAQDAFLYLMTYREGIKRCINDTLDHANYMVNRITDIGMTALIQMTGNGSPRQEALERLSQGAPHDYFLDITERGLLALFNHRLCAHLH